MSLSLARSLRESLLAEMGVSIKEDGGTLGVFSPKGVSVYLTLPLSIYTVVSLFCVCRHLCRKCYYVSSDSLWDWFSNTLTLGLCDPWLLTHDMQVFVRSCNSCWYFKTVYLIFGFTFMSG